jgi:hypothetical protein
VKFVEVKDGPTLKTSGGIAKEPEVFPGDSAPGAHGRSALADPQSRMSTINDVVSSFK